MSIPSTGEAVSANPTSEEDYGTYLALVAIHLANVSDDFETVDTAAINHHIDSHLQGGRPSNELRKQAEQDFYVIWQNIANYQKFYDRDPSAHVVGGAQ